MGITSAMVKELREKSGAGMMDCKKALVEASGALDDAMEILRKRGVALAAKKAGRVASEGLIGSYINDDKSLAVLVEVNCETDFVAKTDGFSEFIKDMVEVIRDNDPEDVDVLMDISYKGKTVKEMQTDVVAKIGENIGVRRFTRIFVEGSKKLAQYIHAGSKIGVIASFNDPNGKLDDSTAKEIAMHIAAMRPQYVKKEDVEDSIIAKEKEIILAQMGKTEKPPEILEKIVNGKINKFFSEVCLNDQIYVRDPDGKSSVAKWLKAIDSDLTVDSFVRLQVGEGVEKK